MKQELVTLDLVIWWTIILLKIIAVAIVCRPSVRRTFPRFALYIAGDAMMSLGLYYIAMAYSHVTYFFSYYISVVLLAGLTLNCLYEIMLDLFQPFTELPRGILARTMMFLVVSASLLITMVWVAAAHLTPGNWKDAAHVTQDLQIGNSMLAGICALVLWIITYYARELGLPWTDHSFAIGLGFAIALTSDLIFSGLIGSTANLAWTMHFRQAGQLGYLTALFVWVFCLAKKEPVWEPIDQPAAEEITSFVHKLDLLSARLSISAYSARGSRPVAWIHPQPSSRRSQTLLPEACAETKTTTTCGLKER